MTRFQDQEAALDHIRSQLEQAEGQLRYANENELPEERFRLLAEQKRTELSRLMQQFRTENEAIQREANDDYKTNSPYINFSQKPNFHSSAFRDPNRSPATRTYWDHGHH